MSDSANDALQKALEAIRDLNEIYFGNPSEPMTEHEHKLRLKFYSQLQSEMQDLRSSWDLDKDPVDNADEYEPAGHPCIVVVGNPVDGLALVGPFSRFSVANNYGDLLKDTWFCTKLEAPAEFNPSWVNEESSGWEEDSEVPF